MNQRPSLDSKLNRDLFKDYYYTKEELINFCRKENLQTTGSKLELIERIEFFLLTGKNMFKRHVVKKNSIEEININSIIEDNFVCSKRHREFYKEQIGNHFIFNVTFQKWLKNNAGKTYQDSIIAYYQIVKEKNQNKSTIDKQFEYNIYIRDFFEANKDKNLKQAIKCWKYKKSLKGHNKYETDDLKILND